MKKNICIIGPLPPPMNGNSKALDTIINSEECKKIFNINTVNLAGSKIGMSGKLTLQKLKTLIIALKNLKHVQHLNEIDTYYITIAQSTVGCMRDVALLHQIFKRKGNAKVVLHLHGGGFLNFYKKANPMLRHIIKKYYSKADTFIVLSPSLKSMFQGITNEYKIKVIENCVDNEFIISKDIIEDKLSKLEISTKPLQIVYLSNMIKTKGYYDVLHAAKRLYEKKIECKFVFAGNFPNNEDKDQFFKFISENGLKGYVEYKGVVGGNDKKELLVNGNIFILPTYYPQEGQPISILEAMAAGMAVITTRHGGIPDVIIESTNGVFVRPQDIGNISDSIIDLINQRGKLRKIGKNNRQQVMEKYLETHYIKKMIEVLNN